jgi:hypothetical protein
MTGTEGYWKMVKRAAQSAALFTPYYSFAAVTSTGDAMRSGASVGEVSFNFHQLVLNYICDDKKQLTHEASCLLYLHTDQQIQQCDLRWYDQ